MNSDETTVIVGATDGYIAMFELSNNLEKGTLLPWSEPLGHGSTEEQQQILYGDIMMVVSNKEYLVSLLSDRTLAIYENNQG